MNNVYMFKDQAQAATGTTNDRLGAQKLTVQITQGQVVKGTVYEIKDRLSAPSGTRYSCSGNPQGGRPATFTLAASQLVGLEHETQGAARPVPAAAQDSQKSVKIQIDPADLETLKNAGYKLCFAKKVGTADYNVVWQSSAKYLVDNTFSWTPQYELFGTNTFQANVTVVASTNVVSIGLGETSILDKSGVLGPPKTGGPETAFTMDNQFGSIHPGVNQSSTPIDGPPVSTPIYVAPEPMVEGSAVLTPVEMVLVWFEQNIQTSAMISGARSNPVEIDLTQTDSAVRLYKDQKWSTP